MDLKKYQVIKRALVTTKAYALNQRLSQLVLEVHPQANKPLIKEALEKLFNVKPLKIRTVTIKGKVRRSGGRHHSQDNLRKKAIVILREGYAVDLAQENAVAPMAEHIEKAV